MANAPAPKTLYDKIFDDHVVSRQPDGTCILYIDRHLVHEVTSPQAFEGLRMAGSKVRAPEKTLAVVDHNIATSPDRLQGIKDEESRIQVETMATNAKDFGIEYYDERDVRQGIVHVIGPEQGFTLPGTTIVCGDSHTSTHGAFGALAIGIGTSEVEHVLATQTLTQRKAKNMRVTVDGKLPDGVTAKDIILSIIGEIGTAGGTGHVIEYAGEAIRALSMEGRMTVCNMSIEGGARAGMVAPDEKTFAYLKGRPKSPKGAAWDQAMKYWETLQIGRGRALRPRGEARRRPAAADRHLGHLARGRGLDRGRGARSREGGRRGQARLHDSGRWPTWASRPARRMTDIKLDRVFIGSCTNGRIEDLREVARVAQGKKVSPSVYAMIVPGSGLVKEQAEAEGLDKILKEAGFDWREAGCSMCLGMNPDQLKPRERCASTSQPQLRGPPGPLRPHPPGVAGHGGGGGDRRAFRGRAEVWVSDRPEVCESPGLLGLLK